MKDRPKILPSRVQRLPDNGFVDPKSLAVGQQFIFEQRVWTVTVKLADGIECTLDPTRFVYGFDD